MKRRGFLLRLLGVVTLGCGRYQPQPCGELTFDIVELFAHPPVMTASPAVVKKAELTFEIIQEAIRMSLDQAWSNPPSSRSLQPFEAVLERYRARRRCGCQRP